MANINCEACNEIKTIDPNLAINGWSETECTSFKNDTGLNPSSGHNDCTDLELMNDCLIGDMDAVVDAYGNCDWREFMHKFIPNLWTVLTAIKCAICGIWTNIHNLWNKVNCTYNGISNLITALNATTQGTAFVRYYRDNSGTGEGYQWNIVEDVDHNLDIYMDADVDNPGSQVADRDYVVLIQNCTDISNSSEVGIYLTYYSSGDTRPLATIRKRQAQHPHVEMSGASITAFSWTTSGAVMIKKGEHVKVNSRVYHGDDGQYRLHQFILTWIPVNISGSLDPSSILPC